MEYQWSFDPSQFSSLDQTRSLNARDTSIKTAYTDIFSKYAFQKLSKIKHKD